MQIDLNTAQLLNSRLFHDLVGAASAINTGLEFMADGEGGDDAVDLTSQSARRLSNRLDFFRAAFGLGGGRQGPLTLGDAGALAAGWYADAKPELDWPGGDALMAAGEVAPPAVKVLLILVMLAEECLPRGGRVTVQAARFPEGLGISIAAQGTGARLPDGVAAALDGGCPAEALTARNVAAHFGVLLAAGEGGRIEAVEQTDSVELAALFPDT